MMAISILILDDDVKRSKITQHELEELDTDIKVEVCECISKSAYESGHWKFVFIHFNNDEFEYIYAKNWFTQGVIVVFSDGWEKRFYEEEIWHLPATDIVDWLDTELHERRLNR